MPVMNESKIEYPCEWCYTVIGASEELLRNAIAEAFSGKEYSMEFSKKSKAGKYISFSVKSSASNEEERNKIFTSLKNHPEIKMVL